MIYREKTKREIFSIGLSLILWTTFSCMPASAQRVLLDRIIALVDEGVILQSELDTRIYDLQQAAARDNRPLPAEDEIRDDVLEALIMENIQL